MHGPLPFVHFPYVVVFSAAPKVKTINITALHTHFPYSVVRQTRESERARDKIRSRCAVTFRAGQMHCVCVCFGHGLFYLTYLCTIYVHITLLCEYKRFCIISVVLTVPLRYPLHTYNSCLLSPPLCAVCCSKRFISLW